MEIPKTSSESREAGFKEFQEAHDITYEEWCEEKGTATSMMPDPEEIFKEYRDPHPDVSIEEWYTKMKVKSILFGECTRAEIDKRYSIGERAGRNIKFIFLMDKGIKKAEELLNVNSKNSI